MSRETPEERSARIRKHGKQLTCRFVLRSEPFWSAEKLGKARDANSALGQEIARLPEKHGISHLRNDRLSRKGGDVFTPTNADEEQKIADYMAERKALEKKYTSLPDFQSDKSALFLVSSEGMEDDMNIVDPPQASQEMYGILQKMQELLKV